MTTISVKERSRTRKLLTWMATLARRNNYLHLTITSLAVIGATILKRGAVGVGRVEGVNEWAARAPQGCRPSSPSIVDNYLKLSHRGRDGKFLNRESSLVASSVVVTWQEHSEATRRTASTFGWRAMPRRTWKVNTTGHGSTSVLRASRRENYSHSPSRTSAIK